MTVTILKRRDIFWTGPEKFMHTVGQLCEGGRFRIWHRAYAFKQLRGLRGYRSNGQKSWQLSEAGYVVQEGLDCLGDSMKVTMGSCDVYGLNGYKLGRLDKNGLIWSGETIVMRVFEGKIYSMHQKYLGRLRDGIAKTDRGELIFTALWMASLHIFGSYWLLIGRIWPLSACLQQKRLAMCRHAK